MKKINLTKFTLQIFNHLPAAEKRITLPTIFTLLRIALVPLIIHMMILAWWGHALLFFVLACLTDLVDGLLARWLNKRTLLGAFLDPMADKLLLLACFFALAFIYDPLFLIPRWFVVFIVSKELMQTVGAFLIYYYCGYLNVQPTILGKMATCIQMVFITWLLACYFLCYVPNKMYYTALSSMVFFVGASFIQYAWVGLRMFNYRKQEK